VSVGDIMNNVCLLSSPSNNYFKTLNNDTLAGVPGVARDDQSRNPMDSVIF